MTRPPLNYNAPVLERALDDLPVPAYVVGRDRRFRWLNRAGVELAGPVVGQPFARVVAPEDLNAARNEFARKLLGETTSDFSLTVIDRHGQRTAVRIASVPLWEDGLVVGVFGLAQRLAEPGAEGGVPVATNSGVDLTPRQFEVLLLLAEGLPTRAIAKRMGVAEETARNHVRGLFRELKVHSRIEAVVQGHRLGLLPLDPRA